jgi:hypothetical protein
VLPLKAAEPLNQMPLSSGAAAGAAADMRNSEEAICKHGSVRLAKKNGRYAAADTYGTRARVSRVTAVSWAPFALGKLRRAAAGCERHHDQMSALRCNPIIFIAQLLKAQSDYRFVSTGYTARAGGFG